MDKQARKAYKKAYDDAHKKEAKEYRRAMQKEVTKLHGDSHHR